VQKIVKSAVMVNVMELKLVPVAQLIVQTFVEMVHVKPEKHPLIVVLTAQDAEIKNAMLLVEKVSSTVLRIVVPVAIIFVISTPKILDCALRIVDTVGMVSVMQIKEKIQFLVPLTVVQMSVVMVTVLLENQHKLALQIVDHQVQILPLSKSLSILRV